MPEPPEPPEDLTPSEQQAWRRGGAAMLHLLGGHAMTLAGALEGAEPSEADDPDECPACGADLVDAFGGAVCLACGYEED